MMRIISGKARGTKLKTLEGENTRPTLERVKEALFSMIQWDIGDAFVLDLFAGSGQLALEALSRGATGADLVDRSPEAVKIIKENIQKTHCESSASVICKDFRAFLATAKRKYDLVFLDPPYAAEMILSSIDVLVKNDLLSESAVVVCEISAEDTNTEKAILSSFEDILSVRKNSVYARSRIIILDRVGSSEE